MSGIGPCLIFLFLAPIIFVALIACDSAKKRKPEQDNSSICDNTRATELPSSSPIAKTDAYAVSAWKKDRYNPNNKETRTLEFNRILSENNNESKRVAKKQKDYSLVNDAYYKAYNEVESMMTDYNAAKEITNNSADLAAFEDGYHFDNYAEDFKQDTDSDNENY